MSRERNFPIHRTFSQRYGYEPLPGPMQPGEISGDLRREIFYSVRRFFMGILVGSYFSPTHERCIERILGTILKLPENQISTYYDDVISRFEQILMGAEFHYVLDLIEITIAEFYLKSRDRSRENVFELVYQIKELFAGHNAPYWLDTTQHPYQFVPQTSKEQGEATQQAIEALHKGGMDSAAAHLRQAVDHINAHQYADAITDCIHAVESVARKIDPKSSATLGPALHSLEQAGLLNHPALKQAFLKLYGYTSNEQGLRHALLDQDAANVGLEEAVFMFGACASFAAYLTQKHRQAGGA